MKQLLTNFLNEESYSRLYGVHVHEWLLVPTKYNPDWFFEEARKQREIGQIHEANASHTEKMKALAL
jgi:hypothetical protein